MSLSQNPGTIHIASEGVIQTVNDASIYVLNQNTSDVATVVHLNDFNDDDTSICTDSTISETANNSFELCNNGSRILESIGDQRHVTYSNIHIENSSDILLGTKAIFNEPVVIQQVQQLVVSSDSRILNHNQQHVASPDNKVTENQLCCCFKTNIDRSTCRFRAMLIAIALLSLLSSAAVAGYFLYVHIAALYAGAIFVCKTNGTDSCYIGSSTFACSNLVSSDDRPYISGHTTADICKIYSQRNCVGGMQRIGTNHTIFDFDALSACC
ncbi:uncharacterized protein LOC119070695 isoform X2 [Bradysia coprophila]|uniref:uncharacterized protein LOC119070695 isoform X2 n=1 Tax=Bradysia coprophila TaxID=38358 RepID=UPI00187DA174|nr:uncharacterized protein LOC119070695 isoform X2 [Bradysia coprophila]